jgi:transposase InsO family protein
VAYWVKNQQDLKNYLNSCIQCSKSATRTQPKVGPIKCRRDTSFPGQRLHLDLAGPVRTVRKYRYILSSQDAFSRKVWLRPLVTKSIQEVAKNLVSMFSSDGVPLELYHDQGKQFQSKVMKELAETFGRRQATTMVYHPRSNKIERCHSFCLKPLPDAWNRNSIG